jgi:hypothetical protein
MSETPAPAPNTEGTFFGADMEKLAKHVAARILHDRPPDWETVPYLSQADHRRLCDRIAAIARRLDTDAGDTGRRLYELVQG